MKNIVILISGGGSNMAAIVNAARRDAWHEKYGARVAAVISNKASAEGLVLRKRKAWPPRCLTTRPSPRVRPLMPR